MKATFLLSVASPGKFPLLNNPEIAFAGRSNVGKSSMINFLLNRRNLVKTANKPGKTRLINFFDVENLLTFVDLPGYGYAAVSKSERESWGKLVESYLKKRTTLSACFILVDIRREVLQEERDLISFLKHYGIPFCIVFTKSDKLSNNKRINIMNNHIRDLTSLSDAIDYTDFSIYNPSCRINIWDKISTYTGVDIPDINS